MSGRIPIYLNSQLSHLIEYFFTAFNPKSYFSYFYQKQTHEKADSTIITNNVHFL